jgi:1-acyl-sn-glycerol-3-phosphate acyltransferase
MARRKRINTPGYFVVAWMVKPPLHVLMTPKREGWENLPEPGTGYIAAVNHVTNLDWAPIAEFLYDSGGPGRFLIKDSLWRVPVVRQALNASGQIPVSRGTSHAGASLKEAAEAIGRGWCVVVFPEGTTTKDPTLWPMSARPGVGRLALATGAPVIPIGHWGVQEVLPPGAKRPKPLPRKVERMRAGPAVDLSDLSGRTDPGAAREATDRVMAAVTRIVADLRGTEPPDQPFDPYHGGGRR